MAKGYHVSRRIDAPADRVWGLLTDSSSYRDWNRAVVSLEGTHRAGKHDLCGVDREPEAGVYLEDHVRGPSQPPGLERGMPLGLFKGERTYRLDERDGATEFSMTEQFSGLLSGLITRAIPDLTDSFQPVC